MFVANSKSNYVDSRPASPVQKKAAPAPKDLRAAREALRTAFVKTGFCNHQGKLSVALRKQTPLTDEGRKKLNALLMHPISIEGTLLHLQEYLRSMPLPQINMTHWKYLRGSYAAYLIDPLARLNEALENFYRVNPKARAVIAPAFEAYCALKQPVEEPNDADFADLYFDEKWKIPDDTVTKIREMAIRWIASLLNKPPEVAERTSFQTLFIPEPNHLTRTAEKIAIITLKTDPPPPGVKELKVDRVMGELQNYCLFSRDDFYIDIRQLPFYPQSFQNDFWQCILDREMQVIRLEERHRNDFSAVLAAVEHYTKGAELDESELALSAIFEAFFKPLTEDEMPSKMELTDARLLTAVLKRIENHSVDPLSFLVNLCAKFPVQYSDRREVLWKAALGALDRQKLGHFKFLATNTPSFDLFVHDVLPLQGTEIVEGHQFRIERAAEDRIESTQRHFRKLMLVQKNYRPDEGHLDVWQQGCKTLHSNAKGSVLSIDFVDLLIEDLLDGEVYSEEEKDSVLAMCQPYLGKLSAQNWLVDLMRGSFWEIAFKYWKKTAGALSLEQRWQLLKEVLPKAAKNELSELLLERLTQMEPSERLNDLLENYAKLHSSQAETLNPLLFAAAVQSSVQDRCRVAGVLFAAREWHDLKSIVLLIDPVPEEMVTKWNKWACGLIAQERLDAGAVKLYCQLNSRKAITHLPKKQTDRIQYGIQALSEEELIAYIQQLLKAGDLAKSLSLLAKVTEKRPILREVMTRLPSATPETFKECVPYLVEFLDDADWMSIIPSLEIMKQLDLLGSLSYELLSQCKDKGLVDAATYAAVLKRHFVNKPTLQLLWEMEYVQADIEEKFTRKVRNDYQSAKQLSLSEQVLNQRILWLSARKRYLECFSLLNKCMRLEAAQAWMQRLLTVYLQEASINDLNAYFIKDASCAIPENLVAHRLEQDEDLRKCYTLFQRVKSRLNDAEKRACLMTLFMKQSKAPFLTKKEMLTLLSEGLCFLNSDCPADVFALLVSTLMQTERMEALKVRLQDPEQHLKMDALSPENQALWLALYAYYQVPLCLDDMPHAETALLRKADVNPVWLFQQIAEKEPQRLVCFPVDQLPLKQLIDFAFDQIVREFSCAQLEAVHQAIQGDPVKSLRLLSAWHDRGDLDHASVQSKFLDSAKSKEALHQLLKWIKERGVQPVEEWSKKFMLMDDSYISLYFDLLNPQEEAAIRMQVIEFCVLHRKGTFCVERALYLTETLQKNHASIDLQSKLQELLLSKFSEKKAWNFEEVQDLVAVVDFVNDFSIIKRYKQLISLILMDLSVDDHRARMAMLELMKRQIAHIHTDHLPRLLRFIEVNSEAIYQNIEKYDGFLQKMLEDFSDSHAVISQFLGLWDRWRTPLRVSRALRYIVDHPNSAPLMTKQLTSLVLQNELTIEDVQLAISLLTNVIPLESKREFDMYIQILGSKKAMQKGKVHEAMLHFFGFLNILRTMEEKDETYVESVNHMQWLLRKLLDHAAFGEIHLLFERFTLFRLDPKELINYARSLDPLIQSKLEDESTRKLMSYTLQQTLEQLFEGVQHHLSKDYFPLNADDVFHGHLKSLHERGSEIPQEWFPSFQEYVNWHCSQLLFIMSKMPAENFRLLIPSIIKFFEKIVEHPACNASTFSSLRRMILDLFVRCNDSANALVIFKQFILVESMHQDAKRIYESARMQTNPELFTNILRGSCDELLQNLLKRGSLLDYQRALAFLKYALSSYAKLFGSSEHYSLPLLNALVDKLHHASPEFKSHIIPQAHELLDILSVTKFTKGIRVKLMRWKVT